MKIQSLKNSLFVKAAFPTLVAIVLMSVAQTTFAGSDFYIVSAGKSVPVGQTISVTAKIVPNGDSVDTARLILNFDPAKLTASRVSFHSHLDTPAPASFIDNDKGVISWGGFDMYDRIVSPENFATVAFKAKSAGDTVITVDNKSKLISAGKDVAQTSSYNSISVAITPAVLVQAKPEPEQVSKPLPPEYNYVILKPSGVCKAWPWVCQSVGKTNLLSIISAILAILILMRLSRLRA